MNDLMNRLSALHPESTGADASTVAADVRRGRRALRRRRAVRGVTGGALALAIAGAATTVAVHAGDESTPAAVSPSPSRTSGGDIRLVDYTGPQAAGFTVATVPEGFVVQGVDVGKLVITRPGDTSSIDDFVGKIVVMLQSSDARFRKVGTQVSVNGQPGYISTEPGAATRLEYLDDKGHDVIVQSWENVGLTNDQLVQVAAGVTVTSAAQASAG